MRKLFAHFPFWWVGKLQTLWAFAVTVSRLQSLDKLMTQKTWNCRESCNFSNLYPRHVHVFDRDQRPSMLICPSYRSRSPTMKVLTRTTCLQGHRPCPHSLPVVDRNWRHQYRRVRLFHHQGACHRPTNSSSSINCVRLSIKVQHGKHLLTYLRTVVVHCLLVIIEELLREIGFHSPN